MTLAPLPDHNRLGDPLWQKLFANYRHVITPLRRNGWIADVEMGGGEYTVRTDLGDGTELIIGATYSLPVDASEVEGWTAVRHDPEASQTLSVLYDSTPEGPQHRDGVSLVPLLTRIGELDVCTTTERLWVTASTISPLGATHNQTGPLEKPGTALARYFDWCRALSDRGCRQMWERTRELLSVFERDGEWTTVHITAAPTAPQREGSGLTRSGSPCR